jgi:probable HAF family extracellular repeat protein
VAADVNEAGQVVGMHSTDYMEYAFVWSSADGLKDIGPGIAFNINDLGQVVGATYDASVSTINHAFIWTESAGMRDIHSHDAPISWAFDINNQGQVVGWYSYGCPGWFCILPPCAGAFFWSESTGMVDLNEETGLPLKCAYDINENGQIVGSSDNGPFVWSQADGIQYITNNPNDEAYSINDAGQVAGFTGGGDVYVWSPGSGMTYLGLSDSGYVFINDLGQVTGSVRVLEGDTEYSHGYLWSSDVGLLTLPGLTDSSYSYGARSNNKGLVVGQSDNQAVLWTAELPPPTLQKQIALIDSKVDTLVNAGTLDQGESSALISKLDAATVQVNKGNNNAARNVLGAFINTVEAFVNSGRLSTVQAQPLIDSTNIAINKLQ